jgi:hypothetical protein
VKPFVVRWAPVDGENVTDPKIDYEAAAARRRRRAVQAVRLGAGIVIVSSILLASPLALGSGGPVKYIVAVGMVGACVGLSSLLHGAWDLWRGK